MSAGCIDYVKLNQTKKYFINAHQSCIKKNYAQGIVKQVQPFIKIKAHSIHSK